ncbi:MAG: M48 family metalloprotease, partial [Acetanaerobacterium sp.]
PNAFAGGLTPEKSYVGVTEGLLGILDDSELEGVLAHEMAHIIQRDVMIATVSIALLSVIIMLAGIFYRSTFFGGRRRSSSKGNNQSAGVMLLIGLAVYLIARLLGTLVHLAISRKREYSADATAVRLCSHSEGLARALEKISGKSGRYDARTVSALGGDEMLALYIYNPKKKLAALFSTHPPIEERIRRVRNMY